MDVNEKTKFTLGSMNLSVQHEGVKTIHNLGVVYDTTGEGELYPVPVEVHVVPDEGNMRAIAAELMAVADHPSQVRYVSWPEAGFIVTAEVFQRFADASPGSSEEAEPVKRKPGRPRKNPVPDTDNAEKEE